MRITAHTLTVHTAEKIAERTDEAGAEEARGSVDSHAQELVLQLRDESGAVAFEKRVALE